jgi:hypothetical protein
MVEETHAPGRLRGILLGYVVRDVFPDADLFTHRGAWGLEENKVAIVGVEARARQGATTENTERI